MESGKKHNQNLNIFFVNVKDIRIYALIYIENGNNAMRI